MEMKFFRAGRGEGKTKWLFEKAVGAREAGYDVWYIGNRKTMESLSNMWHSELRELCPIQTVGGLSFLTQSSAARCFLTDNFLENIESVGFWKSVVDKMDGVWYITMDKECFVDSGEKQ